MKRICFTVLCAVFLCLLPAACAPREAAPAAAEPSDPASAVPTSEPVFFGSGASFSPDATELTVVVDADEYELLDRFPALASVDLSGSPCCPELLAWTEAHPDVSVRYTVLSESSNME